MDSNDESESDESEYQVQDSRTILGFVLYVIYNMMIWQLSHEGELMEKKYFAHISLPIILEIVINYYPRPWEPLFTIFVT